MNIPDAIDFDVGFGDILWGILSRHVTWTDISYKNIVFNIIGIKIEFVREEGEERDRIHVDFPAIRDFAISAY